MGRAERLGGRTSKVLEVVGDENVQGRRRREAEGEGAGAVDGDGPISHNALDTGVGRVDDRAERKAALGGDLPEGRFGEGGRDGVGREDVGAIVGEGGLGDLVERDERCDDGAITGHGVALIAAHGERAGLARERFAEHAAGPTRRGGIGLAGANDDGREAGGTAVEVALARVIVDEEFADRLGHAIRGARREFGGVGVDGRNGLAAVAGDATGEDDAGPGTRCERDGAGGLEDVPPAVEIDAQGIVEALFTFATDHRGEMKNRGDGRGGSREAGGGEDGGTVGDVAGEWGDTNRGMRGRGAVKRGVEKDDFAKGRGCAGRTGEGAAGEEGGAELGAEEAAAAGDEDTHGESEWDGENERGRGKVRVRVRW